MNRPLLGIMSFWVMALYAVPNMAGEKVFAIVIGNNEPPVQHGEGLKRLRYADDDAVRYFHFLKQLAHDNDIVLLTVSDATTQKRFPHIGRRALEPNQANLEAAIQRLAGRIRNAKAAGHETTVFFVFSGHGALDSEGNSFLALSDSGITGNLLQERVLAVLEADYFHLVIDACHAAGVVESRGMFDSEQDAEHVPLQPSDKERLQGTDLQKRFPGMGMLVASSAFEESHEWSRIESGVFSHQVLSGLTGAADVNLDGKIEYSELAAFVSSANRSVTDPRGRIHMIARPPRRNMNAPLIDYSRIKDISLLHGDPRNLGHFHIEMENGLRLMDANLSAMNAAYIALPANETLYLRTETGEVVIQSETSSHLRFGDLQFRKGDIASRGAIEASFREGLFRVAFGVSYYLGYIDSADQPGVQFNAPMFAVLTAPDAAVPPLLQDSPSQWRKPVAISMFAISGAAAVTSVVLGTLTIKTRQDYEATDLQKDSAELNDRYQRLGTAFWVSAATVPVFAVAGAFIFPRKKARIGSVQAGTDFHDTVTLQVRFVF
jgi:hypothetical protein